ncbi:TraR/DksA C4-type zinc finger protein [Thalassorhabdus alkalitolerans]|uniref:TraR/DksA C4-type zinc finger protein n=1 Tax=Thalassorhabdus alkalitolerans TaxID=2282697 RepID=A0ABW0YKS4_9BACI
MERKKLQQIYYELKEEEKELKARLNKYHFGNELELVHESMDELSSYDNHPGDLGTELYEREKDIALNEHAEQELKDVQKTIKALEEDTFGRCEVCGGPISDERLEALPTTTTCIKHAPHEIYTNNERPVEEDIIKPAFGQFEYDENESETFFDAEDAWQEVERYGSSESPSDFYETAKSYNEMYVESDENVGYVEEVEGFLQAGLDGRFTGVGTAHEKYERYLDTNETDSVLGYDEE